MWRYSIGPQWLVVVAGLSLFLPGRWVTAQESRQRPADLKVLLVKAEVTDQDDDEHRLLKERYNAAVDECSVLSELREFGQITAGDPQLLTAVQRAVSSGLELHRRAVDRIKLLEEYVRFAKAVDAATSTSAEQGRVGSQDRFRACYFRIYAELQLLRATKRTN